MVSEAFYINITSYYVKVKVIYIVWPLIERDRNETTTNWKAIDFQ